MNLRAVLWLLGRVILVLAGFELVPAAVAAWGRDYSVAEAFLSSAALSAVIGLLLCFKNRRATVTVEGRPDFFRREGLAAVGLSWVLIPLLGAAPYLISGQIQSPVDAIFEATSGFTTTGASILYPEQIDALPQALGFYRCFTNWLGGIGIVLVFVLMFPMGGRSLFRSEVPGVSREASARRVRDSAFGLVRVYLILSLAEVVLLKLAGLDLYEAVVHTFATVATGGFSTHSASASWFESWPVEAILTVFMFLSGINFGLYDSFVNGKWRSGWRQLMRSTEVRFYTGLSLGLIALISLVLWFWGGSNGEPLPAGSEGLASLPDYSSLTRAFRDTTFTVVSILTSTGFATADFDRWPEVCRTLLMVAAFIGACSGSTGGGLKVIRFAIVLRAAVLVVKRFARPRAVHGMRNDGFPVDDGLVATVTAYFGMYILLLLAGTLLMTGLGVELVSAATAVLSCVSNTGPGLGSVGPAGTFGDLPTFGKLILSVLMVLGRLEFYAIVVLLMPRFWRS